MSVRAEAPPVRSGSSKGSKRLSKAQLEMVEACGRAAQIIGLPRSTGQIYGLLYFATQPLCLDEIAETLGISKASTSVGTRELCNWNAIRQVWVQGQRRDHFEVEPELANLLRSLYSNLVKPRANSSSRRIGRLAAALEEDLQAGTITPEEHTAMVNRLKGLTQLQQKMQTLIELGGTILS